MISKRVSRTGTPQENLKQFALNFSNGVDVTKAPTDLSTVIHSKNLALNLDGSLSLRKPIVVEELIEGNTGFKYLYDGETRLEWSSTGRLYLISKDDESLEGVFKLTTYMGDAVELPLSTTYDFSIPDSLEIINLNTSTIVSGIYVNFSKFADVSVLNPNLYDDLSEYLPRYFKISYNNSKSRWEIEIHSPEPNLISSAEGEFALNPNLILDNPYATRDSYDNSVPSIKGMVAYAKATVVDEELVHTEQGPTDETSYTVTLPKSEVEPDYQSNPNKKDVDVFERSSMFSNVVSVSAHHTGYATFDTSKKRFTANGGVTYTLSLKDSGVAYDKVVVELSTELEFAITKIVGYYPTGFPIYENVVVKTVAYKQVAGVPLEGTSTVDAYDAYTKTFDNILSPDISGGRVTARVLAKVRAVDLANLPSTVAELTESVRAVRYAPVASFKKDSVGFAYLKAFCNLPFASDTPTFYASWSQSSDGIDWTPIDIYANPINVRELNTSWKPDSSEDTPASSDYVTRKYYPLVASSELDQLYGDGLVLNRLDVLEIPQLRTQIDASMYKFTIVAVEELTSEDVEYSGELGNTQYRVAAVVSESVYTPTISSKTELMSHDFGNATLGNKLYHNKAIYSYGHPSFKNNILVSDAGSFITPLYNTIDVDAVNASSVTCLIPWKDYLVSATENAIYLHTKQEQGYYTKTVTTSVGIPEEDSKCCVPVLNGIVFKSGTKLYQLVPNAYAATDSVLYTKVISDPIAPYLEEYEYTGVKPFAMTTNSEYILMLPTQHSTTCLRYSYNSKVWTVMEYPVVFDNYWIQNLDKVHVFGKTADGNPAMWLFDANRPQTFDDTGSEDSPPIAFELDLGQKTDGISVQKQFVESKFMFATEDDIEKFPMQLIVAVDGDPNVTTLDVNTDAPFWKTGTSSVGVAGTVFRLTNENVPGRADSGILRQLIVRYSGKGRSVRHILTGTPTSNFKLYEAYVRYKTLNVKK